MVVLFFSSAHILVKEKLPHRECGLGSKSDCHDVLATPLEWNGMEAYFTYHFGRTWLQSWEEFQL